MRRLVTLGLAALVAIGVGAVAWNQLGNDYHVRVVLPSAPNIIPGGLVQVNGFEAGEIESIEPVDNQAVLELALDDEVAPLHDGAWVEVSWKALLGERHLAVFDGARSNAPIPDGGIMRGKMPEPVEMDTVLRALNPKTRKHLTSLVRQLDGTLDGHEADVRETVRTAGPALNALGAILRDMGSDGPAIKQLIRNTDKMVGTLIRRDDELSTVVNEMSNLVRDTAQQRQRLGAAMKRMPATLDTTKRTLGTLPRTVDQTVPLLQDLRPAMEKLPEMSGHLAPVLRNLRPTIDELRPTLASMAELLHFTPGLLDSADATLPGVNRAVKDLNPALAFARIYTPETVGYLSNWASAGAGYDKNGHYVRPIGLQGSTSWNEMPTRTLPPGVKRSPYPRPGEIEGQPWTDAYGSGMR